MEKLLLVGAYRSKCSNIAVDTEKANIKRCIAYVSTIMVQKLKGQKINKPQHADFTVRVCILSSSFQV